MYKTTVGLLAVIAAKPLLKLALLLPFLGFLLIGAVRSGMSPLATIAGGAVLLLFLLWPRRRTS